MAVELLLDSVPFPTAGMQSELIINLLPVLKRSKSWQNDSNAAKVDMGRRAVEVRDRCRFQLSRPLQTFERIDHSFRFASLEPKTCYDESYTTFGFKFSTSFDYPNSSVDDEIYEVGDKIGEFKSYSQDDCLNLSTPMFFTSRQESAQRSRSRYNFYVGLLNTAEAGRFPSSKHESDTAGLQHRKQ